MAAINSYALLDMVDEVIQQSPDAVLIYTGHNEYYGALVSDQHNPWVICDGLLNPI